MERAGIESIGLKLPSLSLDVRELAPARGVDPNKYTVGLGCNEIALCGPDESAVTLGVAAARRALERFDGSLSDIGLLAVGTETGEDMSRPLSSSVAEALGLRGAFRSYEVKHACYGGTVALRQALEWRRSGAARGKAALVIASDVSLYAPKDPGEPTQGAGAVAFIVREPRIADIDIESFAYSEPAFDFWRPVGEAFPRVEGPLSLDCYKRATVETFRQLAAHRGTSVEEALGEFHAVCFHVPFPKMVRKAVAHLGEVEGWSESKTESFFDRLVDPSMNWNRSVGNAYTASLWLSVASALAGSKPGTRIAAFSYGSGFGSELLTMTAGVDAKAGLWAQDLGEDLSDRRSLSQNEYMELRESAPA
ncbi:MAG: hydroxymethylglutaryl-CoA synthase [Myxococcota bacterium]